MAKYIYEATLFVFSVQQNHTFLKVSESYVICWCTHEMLEWPESKLWGDFQQEILGVVPLLVFRNILRQIIGVSAFS
jgi:hypothetical protein